MCVGGALTAAPGWIEAAPAIDHLVAPTSATWRSALFPRETGLREQVEDFACRTREVTPVNGAGLAPVTLADGLRHGPMLPIRQLQCRPQPQRRHAGAMALIPETLDHRDQ